MTTESTIARDAALSCEAKKHAYRQTQDGVVISFVLHPQEVPDGLALAPLGTRFSLVVVEIGDDEQPVKNVAANGSQAATREVVAGDTAPSPARRPFTSLPLPQQAALLCQDKVFWSFIREEWDRECLSELEATDLLYERYQIESRRDIKAGTRPASEFVNDREQFLAWKLVAA